MHFFLVMIIFALSREVGEEVLMVRERRYQEVEAAKIKTRYL